MKPIKLYQNVVAELRDHARSSGNCPVIILVYLFFELWFSANQWNTNIKQQLSLCWSSGSVKNSSGMHVASDWYGQNWISMHVDSCCIFFLKIMKIFKMSICIEKTYIFSKCWCSGILQPRSKLTRRMLQTKWNTYIYILDLHMTPSSVVLNE